MTRLRAVVLVFGAGCCLYGCVFVPLAVSGVVGPLTGHPLIAVNGLNRPAYPTPSPSVASGTADASGTASATATASASPKPSPSPSGSPSPSPSPLKSP